MWELIRCRIPTSSLSLLARPRTSASGARPSPMLPADGVRSVGVLSAGARCGGGLVPHWATAALLGATVVVLSWGWFLVLKHDPEPGFAYATFPAAAFVAVLLLGCALAIDERRLSASEGRHVSR